MDAASGQFTLQLHLRDVLDGGDLVVVPVLRDLPDLDVLSIEEPLLDDFEPSELTPPRTP